jgi:quercetin dioxygenase-like cupin family protein
MVEIETVRKDWRQRGFSCDIWVDPPGQCWEDFVHSGDELLMLIEGELEMEMDGRCWSLEVGEEVFIPSGILHSVRNNSKNTSRWLYGYG